MQASTSLHSEKKGLLDSAFNSREIQPVCKIQWLGFLVKAWSLMDLNEEHLAPVVFIKARREDLIIGAAPSWCGIDADIAVFAVGTFIDTWAASEAARWSMVNRVKNFCGFPGGFVAINKPIAIRGEGYVPFGFEKHMFVSNTANDLLRVRIVAYLLELAVLFYAPDYDGTLVPFRMSADELFVWC